MTKRISLLLIALSIALGIHTPCYGLYVMVRSGFGELKGEDVGAIRYYQPASPYTTIYNFYHNQNCTLGKFKYKDHKNLSVALGGRFDIFDIGSFGLEVEILGAYANLDQKNRPKVDILDYVLSAPDFYVNVYWLPKDGHPGHGLYMYNKRLLYLKNQRIAGAQINAYWEQYILDWLSVGIGGGIGGAYVCTKFTTLEWCRRNSGVGWFNCTNLVSRRKYVHSGSLLYSFTLFVRAEKFETLFEVGYRHIGLHQMFGAKMYGYTIPKLANLHSDQVYIGVGRTF